MTSLLDNMRALPQDCFDLYAELQTYLSDRADEGIVKLLYRVGFLDKNLAEGRVGIAKKVIDYIDALRLVSIPTSIRQDQALHVVLMARDDYKGILSLLNGCMSENTELTKRHNQNRFFFFRAEAGDLDVILNHYRTIVESCFDELTSAVQRHHSQVLTD